MADPTSSDVANTEATVHVMATPEINILIMQNLAPLSMFSFISSSPAALHTYLGYPRTLLGAAVSHLPQKVQSWAWALLHIIATAPCIDLQTDCANRGFCPLHVDSNNESDLVLELFSASPRTHRWPNLFERMDQPLKMLKKLAQVEEAVDTIASAETWTRVRTLWGTESRSPLPFGYEPAVVVPELWRFEVYCALFHCAPGGKERRTEDAPSCQRSGARVRIVKNLERHVRGNNFEALKPVLYDLTGVMAEIYREYIPTILEAAYCHDSDNWECFKGEWLAGPILDEVATRYRGFIDDLLSLGVSFIAQHLRATFESGSLNPALHDSGKGYWNTDFPLSEIFFNIDNDRHTRDYRFNGKHFRLKGLKLHKIGENRPGYRLSLLRKDRPWREDRIFVGVVPFVTMDFEKVLFANKALNAAEESLLGYLG